MKLDCCLYSGNDGACLIGKHSTGVFGASPLAVLWAWVGAGRPVRLSWGGVATVDKGHGCAGGWKIKPRQFSASNHQDLGEGAGRVRMTPGAWPARWVCHF